jgi:membrane AbrB-like protein
MRAMIDRARIQTAPIAASGVAVFALLGLPLPFLLRPLAACLLAALAGIRLRGMGWLGRAMRTILGLAVGSAITPELAQRLPEMAYSIALVPLFVFVIGAIGYPFFRRLHGFDPPTAYYAAMPGGLQDMLVFGEAAGANVRTLSLIHATRVLTIVSVASILLTGVWGLPLTAAPGEPAANLPPLQALLVITAPIGWWAALRVRLFGDPDPRPPHPWRGAFARRHPHRPPAGRGDPCRPVLHRSWHRRRLYQRHRGRAPPRRLRRLRLLSRPRDHCPRLRRGGGPVRPRPYPRGLPRLRSRWPSRDGRPRPRRGRRPCLRRHHHLVRLVVVIVGAPIFARRTDAQPKQE